MDDESKPLTAFTVGPLGFYKCERMPFGLTNAPATFQRLMETCLGGPQSPLVYHLSGWHSHLLQGSGQSPWETQGSVPEIGGGRTKVQAFKMWAILVPASLSGTCHFCPRSSHWWRQNRGYQELAHTHKHHGGLKFFGVHRIQPQIHPYVHAGGTASAWIDIRQKCG